MKGVYTAQPRLMCNSYVAVVVPQVPLAKLFTLQCGNKYTHPTRLIDYACYYYYYLVFRFRSRNALTPVEVIDLHSLSSRSKLYPPRDIRIPNILKSHEPTPFWCGGSLLDYPIHVRLVLLVL